MNLPPLIDNPVMSKTCSQNEALLSATNPSDSGASSLVLYTLAV